MQEERTFLQNKLLPQVKQHISYSPAHEKTRQVILLDLKKNTHYVHISSTNVIMEEVALLHIHVCGPDTRDLLL
jgi:hypothetical protein